MAWFCWKKVSQKSENTNSTSLRSTRIKMGTIIKWILLSAIPSGFMLAVSNAVTLELGSVPLVWVIPLVLYLLSFVFTFSQKKNNISNLSSCLLARRSNIWIMLTLYSFYRRTLGTRRSLNSSFFCSHGWTWRVVSPSTIEQSIDSFLSDNGAWRLARRYSCQLNRSSCIQ